MFRILWDVVDAAAAAADRRDLFDLSEILDLTDREVPCLDIDGLAKGVADEDVDGGNGDRAEVSVDVLEPWTIDLEVWDEELFDLCDFRGLLALVEDDIPPAFLLDDDETFELELPIFFYLKKIK